jgi:uncharacterized protein YkwD
MILLLASAVMSVAALTNSSLYAAYANEPQKRQSRALYTVQFEIDCHVLTNNERVNMGLQPLYANAKLIAAARKHSSVLSLNAVVVVVKAIS